MTKQEYFQMMKQALRKAAGVGPWSSGHSPLDPLGMSSGPNASHNGLPRMPEDQMQGQFDLRHGVEPSDMDVENYIKSMGGYPQSEAKAQGPSASLAAAQAPAPGQSTADIIKELAAQFQKSNDKKNAANESRFQEIKGNNRDLYGRVMGEVGNWGGVQKQLNDEQAKKTLGDLQANLAARGLGNTTIGDAFRERNSRDLALVNQDLSERKSDRAVRYDTSLTNDSNAFIERKKESGPDMAQMIALVQRLGEAEAYQRARASASSGAQQPQFMPAYDGGQSGMSPYGAMQMAAGMQSQFGGGMQTPLQIAGNLFGNGVPDMQPAWTANAFPHRAGESRQQAYYRRTGVPNY